MNADPIAIWIFCPGVQATPSSAGPSRVISRKSRASRSLAVTVARFISSRINAWPIRPGALATGRSGDSIGSITWSSR